MFFVFQSCAERHHDDIETAEKMDNTILDLNKNHFEETEEKMRVEHNAVSIDCYLGDTLQWTGFKFDYQYLFPRKGHNIFVDSAYVVIPYENGSVWYEGEFVKYSKTHHGYLGKGIHKVRNNNGTIKGVIDYTNRKVTKYDQNNVGVEYDFDDYLKIESHMTQWTMKDTRFIK